MKRTAPCRFLFQPPAEAGNPRQKTELPGKNKNSPAETSRQAPLSTNSTPTTRGTRITFSGVHEPPAGTGIREARCEAPSDRGDRRRNAGADRAVPQGRYPPPTLEQHPVRGLRRRRWKPLVGPELRRAAHVRPTAERLGNREVLEDWRKRQQNQAGLDGSGRSRRADTKTPADGMRPDPTRRRRLRASPAEKRGMRDLRGAGRNRRLPRALHQDPETGR